MAVLVPWTWPYGCALGMAVRVPWTWPYGCLLRTCPCTWPYATTRRSRRTDGAAPPTARRSTALVVGRRFEARPDRWHVPSSASQMRQVAAFWPRLHSRRLRPDGVARCHAQRMFAPACLSLYATTDPRNRTDGAAPPTARRSTALVVGAEIRGSDTILHGWPYYTSGHIARVGHTAQVGNIALVDRTESAAEATKELRPQLTEYSPIVGQRLLLVGRV